MKKQVNTNISYFTKNWINIVEQIEMKCICYRKF